MEHTALTVARILGGRGYTWRFVSLNPVGKLGPILQAEGIPVRGLQYKGKAGWRGILAMAKEFRKEKPDAVIMTGHNFAAFLALGLLCRKRRLLCLHFHHEGVKPRWMWRIIYWLVRKQFYALTFPSDFIRREAETIYPPISRIAHTLPNPFSIPELPSPTERTAARARLGLPVDVRLIGNAGWLIERKRFDVFLRVAARVVSQHPNAQFVIAGDGPLKSKLLETAEELGISRNVRWLGWLSDLTDFYKAMDVILFNSDWDAQGRTPLEGLSYGVPVVASVINGGLAETLKSPDFGFLTQSHDINWMSEKVLYLLTNQQSAEQMAMAGRNHLAVTCDPDEYCNSLLSLLIGAR
jgi:glycosyltransferase involved in cell wall biosynthesis